MATILTERSRVWFNATAMLLLALMLQVAAPGVAAQNDGGVDTAARLLFTEFLYDPVYADEVREWIEIANLGDATADLVGYGVGDEEQESGPEGMLRFPPGASLQPGQALVIAQTAQGFRAQYGRSPDFEMMDSDPAVPDLLPDPHWAGGRVALANSGDELLLLDAANRLIDALSYGDKNTFLQPALPTAVRGQSLARVPADCDTDRAADWQIQRSPAPGALTIEGICQPAHPLPDHLAIGAVQGAGEVSPFLHQFVAFSGQVTGTMEDRNTAGITYYTLFVQDLPGWEDGDPETSDGIAVFLGRKPPAFAVGERVRVYGQVTEFYGLTEIDDRGLSIAPLVQEGPAILPESLQLPRDAEERARYLEAHEGMLVSAPPEALVFGPTHSGCGFALAAWSGQERPSVHSEQAGPPPVVLVQNASDVDCARVPQVKAEDRISFVRGPLTYHFEQYKIVLQDAGRVRVAAAPLPVLSTPAPPAATQIRVATLNLEDYLVAGQEEADKDDRPSTTALERKRVKAVAQISILLGCPALLGVQEVETLPLLLDLTTVLGPPCGFSYQVSHLDSADARGIDVALLSDPRRATVTAVSLRRACTSLETGVIDPDAGCDAGSWPLYARPALEARLLLDGRPLTVWVVHLKSKRGGAAETAAWRLAQAEHLRDLAAAEAAGGVNARYLLLGDINDMDRSTTWLALQEEGLLVDALQSVPDAERYSYVFDGQSELIDGIFLSPALAADLAEASILHANSDFPAGMADDLSDEALLFRASDHDVPLITLGRAPTPTPLPIAPPTADPSSTSTTVPRATSMPVPTAAPPPAPAIPQRLPTTVPPPAASAPPLPGPILGLGTLTAVLLLGGWYWRRR